MAMNHKNLYSWVRLELVDCGKERCRRCASGPSHGPYWHGYWEKSFKLKKEYIGKQLPDELRPLITKAAAKYAEDLRDAGDQADAGDRVDEDREIPTARRISAAPQIPAAAEEIAPGERATFPPYTHHGALLLLNYETIDSVPDRGVLRKKVWNLKQRKNLTAEDLANYDKAYQLLIPYITHGEKHNGTQKKKNQNATPGARGLRAVEAP